MNLKYGRNQIVNGCLVAASLSIAACNARKTTNPQPTPTFGSRPQYNPSGNGTDNTRQTTSSDSCGQDGGTCPPIGFTVSFSGTGSEMSGVKYLYANTGAPVDWQVHISDVPERPVVASLNLTGAKLEQAGSAEGRTIYKVRFTPRSPVSTGQVEVHIRDVKNCLTLTKSTNMCNSASGALDNRFDTKAIIAYSIEHTQSNQPNVGLQIFSCMAKTIGTLSGDPNAVAATDAASKALGAMGCN